MKDQFQIQDEHEANVFRIVADLPREGVIAFALACCLRLLSVYNRASEGQSWRNLQQLNSILESLRLGLINGVPFPKHAEHNLDLVLPDNPNYASDYAAIDTVAYIEMLLDMTESPDAFSSKGIQLATEIAKASFGILADIAFSATGLPMTYSNILIVLKHDLVISERLMQNNDLEILSTRCDSQSIEQVLSLNQRYDITEKGWFINSDCATKK